MNAFFCLPMCSHRSRPPSLSYTLPGRPHSWKPSREWRTLPTAPSLTSTSTYGRQSALPGRRSTSVRPLGRCAWYRLVQVKENNLSPPRIPLAITGQRVNTWSQYLVKEWILGIIVTPMNSVSLRGCHGQKRNYRPRAASRSETRIDLWQAFSFFNNITGFFQRERKKIAPHFARSGWIRLNVLQGMPVEMFAQKIEYLTCLCPTSSRI